MGALNKALLRKPQGKIVGVVHSAMVDGPILELQRAGMVLEVTGGNTLEERKRKLQESADCFIALPGGPGTWEELWEMASLESLGLYPKTRPVAVVNLDGYYDGFVMQLTRAHREGILHRHVRF